MTILFSSAPTLKSVFDSGVSAEAEVELAITKTQAKAKAMRARLRRGIGFSTYSSPSFPMSRISQRWPSQ